MTTIPVVVLAGEPHAVFLPNAFNAGEQVSTWVRRGDAMNMFADNGVSAVAPTGGACSMYADREMDGSRQWHTVLSRKLPNWLAANRGWRRVASPPCRGRTRDAAQEGSAATGRGTFSEKCRVSLCDCDFRQDPDGLF